MSCRGQQRLFGQETEQGWQARHGQACYYGDDERCGHRLAQPAQPAQVAGAGLVIHDARHHKEGALVQGMGQHGNHQGLERDADVLADHGHHQSKLADRGIGQKRLEVVLFQTEIRPQHHGRHANAGEQEEPQIGEAQGRVHAGHQVDAGVDHRSRMQIRAGRGRSGHGPRQPDVGRELCALGKRAKGNQQQHHRVDGAVAQGIAAAEDGGKLRAARDEADHQQSGEQCYAAAAGDKQRLKSPFACLLVLGLVGHQQERGDAGAFPEDKERHDIARHDHAQHAGHKEEKIS